MAADVVLEVRSLRKSFPGVLALDGVTLDVRRGEVHAVVGENGAGKSTLMKILAGVEAADAGEFLYRGRPARWRGVAQAQQCGVVMIHQELNLVDELSVAENISLGREPTTAGFIRQSDMQARAAELLSRLSSDLDPRAVVGDLSVAQKQLVEIAKALSFDASVLIMDEPTAVLSRQDTAALFRVVDQLRSRGVAIIYISHILPEVVAISDRISVLRDGRLVQTLERSRFCGGDIDVGRLSSLMVGRPLADHFPPRRPPQPEVVLQVDALCTHEVHDVSFEVRRGEIFGLAGLVGAGRTELAATLFGAGRRLSGRALIDGQSFTATTPAEAIAAGVAYLSEDRKGIGLHLGLSVTDNITLVALRAWGRALLSQRRLREAARVHIQRLNIKVADADSDVQCLSGGNQQKVSLAKWLESRPRVLLVDEPTRGVDVGAKEEIYRLLTQLAESGIACVMISSELNELIGMCHRIGVMRGGRLVATVPGEAATEELLMLHAAGVAAGAA
jgi:ribose transport system ATP-binding protein